MKKIPLGILLIIGGVICLGVGIDKSIRISIGEPAPRFHSAFLNGVVAWMPTLADATPENCLNNIPYLVALGCVLLGCYIIAKAI